MDEVLSLYDAKPEGFEIITLAGELFTVVQQRRSAGADVPFALQAEWYAFDLHPNHSDGYSYRRDHHGTQQLGSVDGNRTYYGPQLTAGGVNYPAMGDISAEVIAHWAARGRAAVHPILRHRYADVAWDFWQPVRRDKCPYDLPRIMIDAAIEIARRELDAHQVYAIERLKRALGAAIQYKYHVEAVRDAILAYEDTVAADCSPGLWGFSFDLLIANKNAGITPHQEAKIICDLEARLVRLADTTDEEVDPHRVQAAALRLADYYRRISQPSETRRVLGVYAEAFRRKGAVSSNMLAQAWLKDVHDTLLRFDQHDEAKAILTRYAAAGRGVAREMPRHEVSAEVNLDEWNTQLDFLCGGTWAEVFAKLVGQYVIGRDETAQGLNGIRGKSIILNLFSTSLVDRDGRTVAKVGPLDDDLEGNMVRHAAERIKFSSGFLRATMQRLIDIRELDWPAVEGQLRLAPVFADQDWPILECGVRAYLAGDWVVAVHLLIPRVEAAVRRLVDMSGGDTMKAGRYSAIHLRNLDELLLDQTAEATLTPDVTFYLRTLLTDQRGWNLRNDVAHGMEPVPGFTACAADGIFHAVLILGGLRIQEATPVSEAPKNAEQGSTPVGI